MKTGIQKVGVVGAGSMGVQIAAVTARAGIPAILYSHRPDRIEAVQHAVTSCLEHKHSRSVNHAAVAPQISRACVKCGSNLGNLEDTSFVIEPVSEQEALKKRRVS